MSADLVNKSIPQGRGSAIRPFGANHSDGSASATRSDTVLNEDPELAQLLSRLAALQGHAVPAHRFGMLAATPEGLKLAELPRQQRATEWWQARFAQAFIETLEPSQLQRGQLPALWCARDGNRVLLLRGVLGQQTFLAEDAHGQRQDLGPTDAESGVALVLRPQPQEIASDHNADQPQSAADWFAHALRKQRRIFLEAVFATFLVSAIGLTAAMYTMQVYDRVVPTKGFSTLWVLTVGVLIAIALELLLKQARARTVDRACKAIDTELSAVFFGKALDIRMDARPRTVGTFASQIRHFESVRNFMTSSTLFILADAPFALFFIGFIAYVAGPVAWVPLIVLLLSVLAGLMLRGPIERLTSEHMEESNRKNGLLIEGIDGIESVKAANGEWKMLERWRALTSTIAHSELRMRQYTALASNLTQAMQQLSYVGLVAAGAWAIVHGHLTMGGLIACSIVSGRALAPLAQIPHLIVQWKQARIALKALDSIMAMPGERETGQRMLVPESCRGELRLKDVVFAYNKDMPILQVPHLQLKPGERVAVLGAVGSGKSTLIKILSGLYKPSSGSAHLDELEITQLAPEFVREHIGYLPQDVRLFQGTLRENLTLGLPSPSDSQILRAAALTGLDRVIEQHPKGMSLEIAEGGRGLSGGQRQLVGLTRLLLAQPRILLLDEPTASMDAQLEARVMQHLFQELSPRTLVVVVTHKPALLTHVGRILLLERGQVALDGPRDQVLSRLRAPASPTVPTPPQGTPATAQTA